MRILYASLMRRMSAKIGRDIRCFLFTAGKTTDRGTEERVPPLLLQVSIFRIIITQRGVLRFDIALLESQRME